MSSTSDLSSFGLGPAGFVAPRQADVTSALQAQWQAAFGAQVNLDPRSNNGQLINIMAERFALLYELVEAVYNASYPAGAEGVAVDNLLALQGLTRLPATATRTALSPVTQGNGLTLYGLVCYGAAGTTVPAGSLVADEASPPHVFAIDSAITIGSAQSAVQTLVLNPAPSAGTFALTLTTVNGVALTTPPMGFDVTDRPVVLNFGDATGAFAITLGNYGTANFNIGATAVQGSVIALGLRYVLKQDGITGTGNTSSGVVLDFGTLPLTGFAVSGPAAPSVKQSVQGVVQNLQDSTGAYPFSDVTVVRSSSVFTVNFGANAPASNQISTASLAQPLISADTTNLLSGITRTNATVFNTVQGQPAQGVGSATCTTTGPITVLAGALSAIQTPIAGWTGVTNELDCVTGNDVESDAEALARRASLVANQASGPLAAILQRVETVSGVTAAVAVANTSMASQQVVTVGGGATAGNFALTVAGQTTAPVPFNTSAGALQAALRTLTGYETAVVAGTATAGLTIDWGTSVGGQSVPLCQVSQNTTGVAVTVQFGRYPKSVEVVVQGGSNSDVAQAIFSAAPAGLATYGRPVLTTTATTTAGQATITVADTTNLVVGLGVSCVGVSPGTTIASLSGNSVTLSAAAVATGSNVQASFGFVFATTDSSGNLQLVRFSRPATVAVYCVIALTTDMYNVPGQASSGVNTASKWSAGYVSAIQAAVKAAIQAVGIGGTLSATGTGGIANAFRDVAQGVEDAVVMFDTAPNPTNTSRITLATEQLPEINLADIQVSFQ